MNIALNDLQNAGLIRHPGILALSRFFVARISAQQPHLRWGEISIVLVDDRRISGINHKHLGHTGPTDVITFRYGMPGCGTAFDGEIIVNAQRALAEGPRHGGASKELALYLAHGFDHLSGEDDQTIALRRRMRRRELRWLASVATAGLLDDTLIMARSHAPKGQNRKTRRRI